MSLAAVLLSLGAFAQNGETLKGDVNGDGKVDVEDVTSVVDIILSGKTYGYFYFGTTEPTAENFTSLPGAVASYTSIGESVGATVSVDNGETLYMLCPAAWMKGKHVEVEDGEGNSYDFVEDTDAGFISGYVIYKTQAFNEVTDAILRFNNGSAETYYWYVGKDESLLGKNGTSYDLNLDNLESYKVNSIDDIFTNSQSVEDVENNIYVVCPTEWVGQFKLTTTSDFEIPQTDKTFQITSGVTGYSILRGNGKFTGSIIKVVRN